MRSKCAELGDKILRENAIGSALSQDQTSKYDPTTNRCYVTLNVLTTDLSSNDYYSVSLYDGQTRELLAYASDKKGAKSSFSFIKGSHSNYDEVLSAINSLMEDDRAR